MDDKHLNGAQEPNQPDLPDDKPISRREFIKIAGFASATIAAGTRLGGLSAARGGATTVSAASTSGNTASSVAASIPKYSQPLVIPPEMPATSPNYYEIAARQFQEQILPPPFGKTTVWGYGSANDPGTFNSPAFTIESMANVPTRIKWINGLLDASGNYLPPISPVDQTLHWANPPGGPGGTDMHGTSQAPYDGPVPIVTHLHGAHVTPESDGNPQAWFLPAAKNIPSGYATRGSHWDQIAGIADEQGAATFQDPNDQAATTLWYHDHALGMTRTNVYAGLAGFYLIRGGPYDLPEGALPGPAPKLGDPAGTAYYEIPIAIQDRSFNADGSLFFPGNRAFFEDKLTTQLQIPFAPSPAPGGQSDVAPIWNPEFFGDTMMVNGKTWPYLNVEPRRYRFRLLNGCDSRTLFLKANSALTFWQIGAEQGFLAEPVPLSQLVMAPAERADVIVDFSTFKSGDIITLLNLGPDLPYQGGQPTVDFTPADPGTTGQVMQFRVIPLTSKDTSTPPAQLTLPLQPSLGAADNTRTVSLNELESKTVFVTEDSQGNIVLDAHGDPFGPTMALLGTLNADGTANPLLWSDPITETPTLGSTEIWEIHNFTADGHPIHLHLVAFQVINREDKDGIITGPQPWETGYKDTVIALPGQITRLKAKFDIAGLYVWHCHIISHEDNEMMRPFEVVQPPAAVIFPDVPAGSEFATAINYLAARRIVSGYADGNFGPGDPVQRAQLAKMTILALGKHTTATNSLRHQTFPDVSYTGQPYPFDFVEEATEQHFVIGYSNGLFGPFDSVTKVQLVRTIVRATGAKLAVPPAGYQTGFTDVPPADVAFVAKAKFNGLIDGKTGTPFEPYSQATRGQVAQIIYNAIIKFGQ